MKYKTDQQRKTEIKKEKYENMADYVIKTQQWNRGKKVHLSATWCDMIFRNDEREEKSAPLDSTLR